jgi:hypothetical protein
MSAWCQFRKSRMTPIYFTPHMPVIDKSKREDGFNMNLD